MSSSSVCNNASGTGSEHGSHRERGPLGEGQVKPVVDDHPFTEDIIRINVGDQSNPTVFTAHRRVMIEASPFFRAAFTNGMRETHTGALNLPEADPEIFAFILRAIYADRIRSCVRPDSVQPPLEWHMKLCVQMEEYCLNHLVYLHLQKLEQDHVSVLVIAVDSGLICHVYQNTALGSQTRRFVTSLAAYSIVYDRQPPLIYYECCRQFPEFGIVLANEICDWHEVLLEKKISSATARAVSSLNLPGDLTAGQPGLRQGNERRSHPRSV